MTLDQAWQRAVVERFGYCERCHTTEGLAGHHHIPRRYRKVRHDVKNGICLCVACHQWAHAQPTKSKLFGRVTIAARGDFKDTDYVQAWERTAKYPHTKDDK